MKLARHTFFNLLGLGAPLLFAIFSIPALYKALGAEQFGLLTLIWAVTSYFGLFDLGLGRALTQRLAIALERGGEDAGELTATALLLMTGVGLLGALLLLVLAPWGVGLMKDLRFQQLAIHACWIMAFALPAIVVTAGLRGVLEACHAFEVLNYIRLPMGMWTFLGPWVVVTWRGPDLLMIAVVLAVGRWCAAAVHAWFAWRALPQAHGRLAWRAHLVKPLCSSGGWLMVSNLVNPFMAYVDRFVIGAAISTAAVAYYTTPQELVTKLWIIPGALTGVLFPTFAVLIERRDPEAWTLFDRAVAWLYALLLPVTAALALFAHEILSIWLHDAHFSSQAAPVLRLFAVGIFASCLAHVPYTWVQSSGNNRPAALLHIAQATLYVPLIWLAAVQWGLVGAAYVWLIRGVFDSAAMTWLCHRQRPAPGVWRHVGWLLGGTALPIVVLELAEVQAPGWRAAVWLCTLAVSLGLAYRQYKALTEERSMRLPVPDAAAAPDEVQPLVTIVTPVYNQAGFLAATIESVLAQTYPNIEYIVVDDGSTDNSLEVAQRYGDRVRVVSQQNAGQAAALNAGWGSSRGEILAYLSSDDRLLPDAVSTMVRALQRRPDCSVAYCDFWLIDADGQRMQAVRTEEFSDYRLRVHLVCQPGPGAFFRREVFDRTGGWDAGLRQVPDYEFWLRASRYGAFQRVPYALAEYRIHEESASFRSMSVVRADEIIQVTAQHANAVSDSEARMAAVARSFAISAMNHAQSGRPHTAVRRALGAVKRHPATVLELMLWRRIMSGFFRRAYYRLIS